MPHAPAARVDGDSFYDPWPIAGSCLQTRRADQRRGFRSAARTAIWITAEARIGLRPALPGVASAAAARAGAEKTDKRAEPRTQHHCAWHKQPFYLNEPRLRASRAR